MLTLAVRLKWQPWQQTITSGSAKIRRPDSRGSDRAAVISMSGSSRS